MVPNVPCGVERNGKAEVSTILPSLFLMYRVELKARFGISCIWKVSTLFLMYRVELKDICHDFSQGI